MESAFAKRIIDLVQPGYLSERIPIDGPAISAPTLKAVIKNKCVTYGSYKAFETAGNSINKLQANLENNNIQPIF